MSGINDDPASRKRDAMLGSYLSGDMRLHIDGSRACLTVELRLFFGARDKNIGADDVCVQCVRKDIEKPLRPGTVGRNYVVTIPDGGCHDPIPRGEPGGQPPGDSKTDDPRSATPDCRAEGRTQPRTLIANDRYPWTACNARLKRQTGNGNDSLFPRHPYPASRHRLSQRPVPRSTPHHDEKSKLSRACNIFWG